MPAVDLYAAVWSPTYAAMIATIAPRPVDRLIRRLVLEGPGLSRFSLYTGLVPADPYLRSTTGLGSRNAANLDPPLLLPAGSAAIGVWTGGSTASNSTARMTVESDGSLPGG